MILITGCGGYIGSRLAKRLLKNKIPVRGLVMQEEYQRCSSLEASGLDLWVGDLTKPESLHGLCKDVHCVYHFAGGHYATIEKTRSCYIDGLHNLFSEMMDEEVKRFIFLSNGAVYKNRGDAYLTEGCTGSPMHPYGSIILETEELLQEKMPRSAYIFRVGEVYGTGTYNPYLQCRRGVSLLGDGMNYISLIHEQDLLTLLENIPDRLAAGIYNITDDFPVKQKEYYQYIMNTAEGLTVKWDSGKNFPKRIYFSIHGLRSLNIKMSNIKIKNEISSLLQYPSYQKGLEELVHELDLLGIN